MYFNQNNSCLVSLQSAIKSDYKNYLYDRSLDEAQCGMKTNQDDVSVAKYLD